MERFCISGIEVLLCFIRRETESTSIAKHWPTSRAWRERTLQIQQQNNEQRRKKWGGSRVINTEVLLRIQWEDTYRGFKK